MSSRSIGSIRVFIADDHAIVRTGLRRLFEDTPDIHLCGEAASVVGLTERARRERWDVVVLDSKMPGSDGPGTVRQLLALPSPPQVVVFTTYPEDSHAMGYLRAGACAFINKGRSTEELIKAVRMAAQGRRYITPTLADYLFEHQLDPHKSVEELLSDRELEVVRALAQGQRATEIAQTMSVAPSTVYTYIQRFKDKFGVRTAVEMVQFATENGIL